MSKEKKEKDPITKLKEMTEDLKKDGCMNYSLSLKSIIDELENVDSTTRFMEENGYMDMEDITCPKCGSDCFEWDNVGSYPNSDEWECECDECGKKFTVFQESFYKIEKDDD